MKRRPTTIICTALLLSSATLSLGGAPISPTTAPPVEGELSIWDALRPIADMRARYEHRGQDGLDDAHAGTFRARLGLQLDKWNGFSALAEYEGTQPVDRDSYQAASVHGLGQNKAIIADPESHELNRLWLGYEAFDTKLKVGRQRTNLDNQRFVGAVGWRQNEQTFDAVSLENSSIENLLLSYSYVEQVNRIFGSGPVNLPGQHDFEGDTHLTNLTYTGIENTTLSGYGYWMDLNNNAGATSSNQTFGASLSTKIDASENYVVPLYAEFAYQEDAFHSPLEYSAIYYHISVGLERDGHGVTVGYESLADGFRTPLATLHKFNGYTDKFLATPADGLGDLYIAGNTKLPGGIAFKPSFHWFGESGNTGFGYGKEVDAVLVKKLNEQLTILAKYGYYFADGFAQDTSDFTIQLGYTY